MSGHTASLALILQSWHSIVCGGGSPGHTHPQRRATITAGR
jgi:hypothetical protein